MTLFLRLEDSRWGIGNAGDSNSGTTPGPRGWGSMYFHWGPLTRRQGTPKLCPWSSTSPARAPRERAAGRWQRNTLPPCGISVPWGWALGTPLVAQVDSRACVPTAASEPLSQGRARMEKITRARCPLPPCLGPSRELPWGTRENQMEKCLVRRKSWVGQTPVHGAQDLTQSNILQPWQGTEGRGVWSLALKVTERWTFLSGKSFSVFF